MLEQHVLECRAHVPAQSPIHDAYWFHCARQVKAESPNAWLCGRALSDPAVSRRTLWSLGLLQIAVTWWGPAQLQDEAREEWSSREVVLVRPEVLHAW